MNEQITQWLDDYEGHLKIFSEKKDTEFIWKNIPKQ